MGLCWDTIEWHFWSLLLRTLHRSYSIGVGEVEVTPVLPPGDSTRVEGGGGGGGVVSRGGGGGVERGRRGELVLVVQMVLLRDGGMDLQLVLENLRLYQSLHRERGRERERERERER